jgi:peptidoglycan/xylan/chitin deacetylase (PgdA/CDA1 family)
MKQFFHLTRLPHLWLAVIAAIFLLWFGAAQVHAKSAISHKKTLQTVANRAVHPTSPRKHSSAASVAKKAAHHQTFRGQQTPDCQKVKCIALSFDDGPSAKTTPKILATLEKNHVHATFFLIGVNIDGNGKLVRRMYYDGDEIGNHTWSHPDLTTLKSKQIKSQIARTQNALEDELVPAPTLLRPPYGKVNKKVQKHSDLTIMLWNEDPQDWKDKPPKKVADDVISHAKPGAVVDMHGIHERTVKALPKIVKTLKKHHYHFVTVSHLLNLDHAKPSSIYDYRTLTEIQSDKLH